MSTAASEFEDLLPDTCGSLPPGGHERHSSPSYQELLDVVTCVVKNLGLDWEADTVQAQSQSKLNDRFLTSRAPAQPCKPLPFLALSAKWRSSLTSTRRFQGPGRSHFQHSSQMPRISPPLLTRWVMVMQRCSRWKRLYISRRTRPGLGSLAPSSHRRNVESRHDTKSYSTTGEAAAPLHSMAVLQAHQAELFKELDKGEGITPEAVKELQGAMDLELRATKHTARAVGRSMVGMVTCGSTLPT